MQLKDLLEAVRRYWILAGLALAVIVGLGAAAAFLPAPTYRATATLLVQPSGGVGSQSDYFLKVEAVRYLVPGVVQQVATRTFQEAVKEGLPPEAARSDVRLAASFEPGSPILRVSAEGRDRAVLDVVANRAATLLIDRPLSPLIQLSVVDPAHPPSSPSGPLRVPILVGSVVLGLIASVFVVLGASSLRRRSTSAEELRAQFGLEVLGEIPWTRHFPNTVADFFSPSYPAPAFEAYQRLRINLEIALASRPISAISITSCTVGEGKSAVASCLAWLLGSLGRDVALVDADLRRPSIHQRLQRNIGKGLTEVAAGADVSAAVQTTALPSLMVVTAGRLGRHPTEAVSTALPRVLDALEAPDRLVIVDSPPMGVAEAPLITVMTDAVILVVDDRRRDPAEIERVLAELGQADALVLGAVINRVRRPARGRTSDYYSGTTPERR